MPFKRFDQQPGMGIHVEFSPPNVRSSASLAIGSAPARGIQLVANTSPRPPLVPKRPQARLACPQAIARNDPPVDLCSGQRPQSNHHALRCVARSGTFVAQQVGIIEEPRTAEGTNTSPQRAHGKGTSQQGMESRS